MSDANTSLLRVGTSSWTAKGWETAFYPHGTGKVDWITHYSTRFSTVEIDATFYRIPSRSMVENWRERTPDGFLFAAKVPRIITHEKFLMGCEAELHTFLDNMSLLGSRLGPILFQFPYYSKKSGVNEKDFIKRLHAFLPMLPHTGFQFALEIRN